MKLTQSLRWRMQFWHGLLLAAALSGFGVMAHRHQKSNDLRRIDVSLERDLSIMLANLREETRSPRREGQGRPLPRPHRPQALREFMSSAEATAVLSDNDLDDDVYTTFVITNRNIQQDESHA